jgi:hypothetical protein
MDMTYADGTLTIKATQAGEAKMLEQYAAELGIIGENPPSESSTMFTAPPGALILVPSGCFGRQPT